MRTAGVTALVTAVVLLAGCGGSSSNGEAGKSAAQILTDTKAAALAASSVHYAGTINENGSKLDLDMQLASGKGGKGTITIGGHRIDIVRIGPKVYFKGDEAFYRQFAGATAAKLFAGKWIMAPSTNGNFASFTPLTDMAKLFGLIKNEGKLAKGAESTVDGQKVIAITSSKAGTGTLYVATTGKPYPVELAGPSSSSGALHFSNWNGTVTLAAPSGAIDLSKLTG
ncbi:MAG TPA: hypothetical protein VMT74_08130 [Gaiellaceae bacterium]|nr:hypothetical protein [Gaiellaceae bacterium]